MAEFARGLINAYQAGTQERQADDKRSAIKSYLPGAMAGDRGQAAQLSGVDPELGMKITSYLDGLDEKTQQREVENSEWVASQLVGQDGKIISDPSAYSSIQMLGAARGIKPDRIAQITPENAAVLVHGSKIGREYLQQGMQNARADRQEARQDRTFNETVRSNRARENAAASGGDEASLPGPTLAFMADQYLSGDKSVLTNLGRGAQGAKNIIALRSKIATRAEEMGLTPQAVATVMGEFEGFKAGSRTLGNRTANIGMAINEAYSMADLVTEASKGVPRTEIRGVNDALNAWRSQTGDPRIVRFGSALNSFINAYARAISPTGQPTVSDKEHARDMLNTGFTKGQVDAVIDQLKSEMQAARKAPGQTREEVE
jgi:hypothetical protein